VAIKMGWRKVARATLCNSARAAILLVKILMRLYYTTQNVKKDTLWMNLFMHILYLLVTNQNQNDAGKTGAIVIDELELDSQAQTVVSWDPASLLHFLDVV
jgi:hypothetical protein